MVKNWGKQVLHEGQENAPSLPLCFLMMLLDLSQLELSTHQVQYYGFREFLPAKLLATGMQPPNNADMGFQEVSIMWDHLMAKISRMMIDSPYDEARSKVVAASVQLRVFQITWTTTRRGRRSFWAACRHASRESRWQSMMRQSFFRSCSVIVGCVWKPSHKIALTIKLHPAPIFCASHEF